jgi:hypothetical protein
LLAALVAVALLGAAGVLATGVGLHRGIAQIKNGLAALDQEFTPDLPHRRDELGEISEAILAMARTRRRLEHAEEPKHVRNRGQCIGRERGLRTRRGLVTMA